jgi:tripartite ATP-independent transporter DctP family solute receptor
MAEAVQLGTLEMCIPATAALAGFDPRIQIIDFPYLFEDRAEAYAALDGELGNIINNYLPEQGFVNLGYPENGFRHITNNSKPIFEPADLKGLKIRTMEIPAHIDYFKALGANPTPMSWGELYTALQQGTVDGQENPIAIIYDGRFYEVQKYCSLTGHFYSPMMLLTSKAFMDGLPEDLREVVERAARMFVLAQREMIAGLEEERIEELKAAGMEINVLTDEQKEMFAEAANVIYEKYEDIVGKEVMEIAQEIRN